MTKGPLGVHPVANGKDGVRIVVLEPPDPALAFLSNCQEFLGSSLLRHFAICESIFQMQAGMKYVQVALCAMPLTSCAFLLQPLHGIHPLQPGNRLEPPLILGSEQVLDLIEDLAHELS